MALLSIYRGTQAEVSKRPVSDGALLFATDTKKIYLDKGSSRVEMSSLQDLSDYVTNEELKEGLATKAPLSHSHTTAQVTGLDSALAGKAASSHTHNYAGSSSAGGAATSAAKVNVTTLTNQSLNNYRTPGTFFAGGGGNTCTNKPSGVDNFGMFVIQSAGGWQTQFLYGSNHVMYTRTYIGGTWTSWVEVYTSANKPTASEIGAAASSHNHSAANITSGTLAVARGGTGATSAASARSNIGAAASDIIAVQSSQPSSSTCKLWIQI